MHCSKKDFHSSFCQTQRDRLTGSQLVECEQSDWAKLETYISFLVIIVFMDFKDTNTLMLSLKGQ
jgi:hypothetical protein